MSHDAREAIEFLLWQYDRGGPLGDCKEAWEKLRATLSPGPVLLGEALEAIANARTAMDGGSIEECRRIARAALAKLPKLIEKASTTPPEKE